MRTIISLLLFLTLSAPVLAKKILLSPGLGFAYTSTNALLRDNAFAIDVKGGVSMFGGFKLAMEFSKLQVGIGVQYGGQANSYGSAIDSGSKVGTLDYESVGKFLSPYVFVNRSFKIKRAAFYAGINTGYSKNVFHRVRINLRNASFGDNVAVPQYGLLRMGAQIGYNMRIASNCLFFAEAGVNYLSGKVLYQGHYGQYQPWKAEGNTSWQIPVMAGISLEMR